MDKDNKYWSIHKSIYMDMLNELDNEVVSRIYKNPNCAEARLLSKRVDKEVYSKLNQAPVI